MRRPSGLPKPVHWMGSALNDLKALPEPVQKRIGRALLAVQFGGRPREATPLLGFSGASVLEIRDDYDSDTYRCIYTVRFAEAVYVLHAFQKKSRSGIKPSRADLEMIRLRLAQAEELHREQSAAS